ncbi:hypothetical protein MRB53_012224 [Persea americana]|uniref:Uncharacterized protein n=1 Tax=Persea americana TaxID=3435 RepID=A0ACC2LX20_PERAE|nr:hypothetical protein MRB53_012224 [Persea americana]
MWVCEFGHQNWRPSIWIFLALFVCFECNGNSRHKDQTSSLQRNKILLGVPLLSAPAKWGNIIPDVLYSLLISPSLDWLEILVHINHWMKSLANLSLKKAEKKEGISQMSIPKLTKEEKKESEKSTQVPHLLLLSYECVIITCGRSF